MGAEIRCCIPTLCTGARGTIGARLALLVSSVGRSRQYRAKSLELACNEIEEGAHARRAMEVTVGEEKVLRRELRNVVDRADELTLAIPDRDWQGREPGS